MDGVSIRLIINGAYLDEDIQDVVDRINNDWNITNGWDASAVIMSEDDDVMKLHNKGAIVDGESVLFQASIGAIQRWFAIVRWDSLSPLPRLLNPTSIWYADWNRLDNVTDTDNDGMPDIYEVNYGLNRTVAPLTASWSPMQTTTTMVFPISMNTRLVAIRSIQIPMGIAFSMLLK